MLEWCDGLPGFKSSHAMDSLFVAQGYLGELGEIDRDALFWLALDVTYWYWVDDRTDESLLNPRSDVDWETLFVDLGGGFANGRVPESDFVCRLGRGLAMRGACKADMDWWLQSTRSTLAAFRFGEEISRGQRMPSFAEYLEVGSWSSTVRNILAAASVIFEMRWASRRTDPLLMDLERYLGLVARLENDVYGFEKERREGCFANAVLLLERVMSTNAAAAFVDEQRQAYEMLLVRRLKELKLDDPVARFITNVLAAHRAWYSLRPRRYVADQPR